MIASHFQELVYLIANIKGFECIDDYIIQIVKDYFESIREEVKNEQ
jgi:hypothetical protein